MKPYVGGEEHSGSTGRGTGNKVLIAIAVELKEPGKDTKTGLKKLGRVRLATITDASKTSLVSSDKKN